VTQAHLFVTCLIDTFFPQIGECIVHQMRCAGAQVSFLAEPTCCGQPAFNAGYRAEALVMARRLITALESSPGDIVIPSGSCTAMIRHRYLELFADDPHWLQRSMRLAGRVWEFSEYLVDRLRYRPTPIETTSLPLAYHPSCHLQRGLGIDRQPLELLRATGREVCILEPDCCGFGGVFSIDMPEISGAMLKRRLRQIADSGAGIVVAADVGCLMHLEGGLRRSGSPVRCLHIAQVLNGWEKGLA
jgi:L-lactate dehydrogenase complex protein LldE